MAKAPRAGFSKTRLVPPLSPQHAAELSAAFLRDTTDNLARAAAGADIAGYVAYAPAGLEALLAPHVAPGTTLLLADGSAELPSTIEGFGRCLLHAVTALLQQGHASACVLNADGPTLPTAVLIEAARVLAQPGDHAVLGPAEDGGYYLLGLKSAHAALFEDIAWSTDQVARQTRERAAAIGLRLVELPVWYDIDDAEALAKLVRAPADAGPDAYPAPVTRACLARMRPAA